MKIGDRLLGEPVKLSRLGVQLDLSIEASSIKLLEPGSKPGEVLGWKL